MGDEKIIDLLAMQRKRLSKLPRIHDMQIEGGIGMLSASIPEMGGVVQIQVTVWLDVESGFVRSTHVYDPQNPGDGPVAASLNALVSALTGPFPFVPAGVQALKTGLPEVVHINDKTLAEAARKMLAPLNVQVEYSTDTPVFDDAFAALAEQMGLKPDGSLPEPFSWDIDPKVLPPLYKAAATYWRAAPWRFLPDNPPVAIHLGEDGPEPGVETLYASILGAGGIEYGAAFTYSLEAFENAVDAGMDADEEELDVTRAAEIINALEQSGVPVNQIPPQELNSIVLDMLMSENGGRENLLQSWSNSMSVLFDPEDETNETYVEWVRQQNLSVASRDGLPTFHKLDADAKPVKPNEREARALALALNALAKFTRSNREALTTQSLDEEELSATYKIDDPFGIVKRSITVTFPPPGYEWQLVDEDEDEDMGDIPPEGMALIQQMFERMGQQALPPAPNGKKPPKK